MMAHADGPGLLVVDDESDILDAVATYLEEELEDVRVYTSQDARTGLDIIESEGVGLVLSDYRMPGMDGLAFLLEVHRRHPEMPNILMTAYPDSDLKSEAEQNAGVRLFLPKPIDLDQLTATVRDLLQAGST